MSRDFETVLANHCAPLLYGKKPAILLAEAPLPPCCEWELLRQYGLRVLRLKRLGGDTLLFIYNPELLAEAVRQPLTRQSLRSLGYGDGEVRVLLRELCRRVLLDGDFPHEIGFFLGYPPEDVLAFIAERGGACGKCKCCGTWKAYGDAERASAIFDEYAYYRKTLLQEIACGGSIFNVIPPALAG